MRARLRHADSAGVRWVAVFGEDEVKDAKVTLRDMAATEPETLASQEAIQRIVSDTRERQPARPSAQAGEKS
jgi:histidyl-tRNA synthetase